MLEPGASLGPYEVVAPIGAGGMGEVYQARDTRLDRTVAVKLLSAADPNPERLQRFRREARAVSRLNHPNICALFDISEQDGKPFLVMEYVSGETLAKRIEAGPLPVSQVLRYGMEIATALDCAHREGIVHRDLKPANVMITRDGVKLLDFGLAQLTQAAEDSAEMTESNLTREGVVIGTVPYMAPEQVEGRRMDARTDIFALGVVLYEMTTGKRPFRGDSVASLMAAILHSDPTPPATLRPLTPPLLDRVVQRCLAKSPDDRWQTARDLAAELRWLQEGGSQVTVAQDRPPVARPVLTQKRLRLAGLAAAGVVAGLAAGLLLARPKAPAVVPAFRQLTFRAGILHAARFAPDGESFVYTAAWEGGPVEMFLGRQGSTEARPLGLNDARILAISRSGEMALLLGSKENLYWGTLAQAPLAGGAPRELREKVTDADWLPDGQLAVLTADAEHGMELEFPQGNKVYETRTRQLSYLRVSPRGDRVAFCEGQQVTQGDVVVMDRSGKKTVLSTGWVGLLGLGWSPDGEEIWFTAARPNLDESQPALRAVSLAGKERLLARAPTWLEMLDVAGDGRVLLQVNSARAGINCLAPGQSQERSLGWLDSSWVAGLSADGKTLLLGEGAPSTHLRGVFAQGVAGGAPNGAVYLRKTDGSPAVRLGEGNPEGLSPDGKWVLLTGMDRKEWQVLPTGPGRPRTLPRGPLAALGTGAWLDSRRIVFSAAETGHRARAYVQDVEGGEPQALTPEGVDLSPTAPVAPDGKSVLTTSEKGWQLYPVGGGSPRPVPFPTPGVPLQWSADGRTLFVRDAAISPVVPVYRQDVASGRRTPWRTIAVGDPAGVDELDPVVITPDGQSYCYTYTRTLAQLQVASGLVAQK